MAFCSDCDRDFLHNAALRIAPIRAIMLTVSHAKGFSNHGRHVSSTGSQVVFINKPTERNIKSISTAERPDDACPIQQSNAPQICVPCRKQWTDADELQGHFKTAELHKHTYCNKCDTNFDPGTPNSNARLPIKLSTLYEFPATWSGMVPRYGNGILKW